MKKLFIESNEDEGSLILTGDINSIFENRRASRYFRDTLAFTKSEDSLTVFSTDPINTNLHRIKKICEMIGADLVYSQNISDAIAAYASEEEKFRTFSEKARLIRDNHCNPKEFKDFTISIQKNLKNRSLYPLQLLSAYHLAFSQNACNFSVPGAGKTSVVYGAYAYLSNLPPENIKYTNKLLIISPLSAFGPWELEYEECFGRTPSIKRLSGNLPIDDKKQYLYSATPAEITLLSYASVPTLQEELIYFLKNNKVMVVLDEAHKIKNTDGGIIANSILELATYCSSRVILTGTPAPNGYEDLYNLYKFIWPTKNIIRYRPYQLKDMNKSENDPRVNDLIHEIKPFFIRVRKSDLNIPEAVEHPPILVPMGYAQRRIYDAIEKRYMTDLISTSDRSFQNELVKAKLIRLMQASTNPNLLKVPLAKFSENGDFSEYSNYNDEGFIADILKYAETETPNKFIKAKEIIEKIIQNNEKVVVWAIYINNILDFEKYLKHNGINCKTLYGATPVATGEESDEAIETREKIIKDFHDPNSDFKVIIANPFAVSESISLHKVCHNAIYLERSFNAAHFIQSKDRIHRYGLEKGTKTNYFYLLSENSVDGTIHNRLQVKEQRLQKIIESMPIPLFKNIELEASESDIKALIEDYVTRTKKM